MRRMHVSSEAMARDGLLEPHLMSVINYGVGHGKIAIGQLRVNVNQFYYFILYYFIRSYIILYYTIVIIVQYVMA